MHNSHATPGFNSNKTSKTGTNKSNNKANIKLTRKHQFSNVLARARDVCEIKFPKKFLKEVLLMSSIARV